MHVTDSIYYREPYLTDLDVVPIALVREEGRLAVVLDRTICYPEGGGQPGDRARLDDIPIIDTRKASDGSILHILADDQTVELGKSYRLSLDWARRYDFMQQHTAQHLVSGVLHAIAGIGTVAVHFGQTDFTIETDAEAIDESTLQHVEDRVNEIVRVNVAVSAEVKAHEDAQGMGLRRAIKVDGDVRLVSIGDYDVIACGGVHVGHSSELLYVLCIGSERIRGHVRTQWLAGSRAVAAIRRDQSVVKQLVAQFSAQPHELVGMAQTVQTQLTDTRYKLRKANEKLVRMQLATLIEGSQQVRGTPVVALDASEEEEDFLKHLAEASNVHEVLALCALRRMNEHQLAWLIVLKGPGAARLDFASMRNSLLPLIGGKGGGKPPMWQGVGDKPEAIARFLQAFIEMVSGEQLA
jgi:alanyl-tRNA synthetase